MKILLPTLFFSMVTLCLSHGASAQTTVLIFGDSLSAGFGIPREAAWPTLLQQQYPQLKIVNASISGETTAGGLRRIDAQLAQFQPKIVVLALGANDGLRGGKIDDIEQNLNDLIRRCHAAHAEVLLVGMQLPPNYGLTYTAQFKAIFPKIARQQRLKLVPFLLAGLNAEHYQADNLHPNVAAQTILLQNVLTPLKSMLKQ
jgi:acyl-CoA thioesterase-1